MGIFKGMRKKRNSSPSSDTDDKEERDGGMTPITFLQSNNVEHEKVARGETMAVNVLRAVVLVLLIITATVVCVKIYFYTRNDEHLNYEREYEDYAQRIIESFHDAVERRLGAIHSLGTAITSYAIDTNKTFPFVTVPNFAVRGSDLRVQADAMFVHWMPLVTDEKRLAWESYALEQRFQIDEAFKEDSELRCRQDEEFGLVDDSNRKLEEFVNETILGDGTGFHPKIWSNGIISPYGDEAYGSGPYLPTWQRSPINGAKQQVLNLNFANTKLFHGMLQMIIATEQAVMNRATVPAPLGREMMMQNLALGQYRHNIPAIIDDPLTYIGYPIFNSFNEKDRKFVGVVATNIHWKLFFDFILQPPAMGIVCVLENSYNQTLAYRIDGPEVTYLGEGDPHDRQFDHLLFFADINAYVERMAGPQTRAYTAVPLNKEFGRYTLRIYPAYSPEYSDRPLVYAVVVASTFAFTSIVYIIFTFVVERRQKIVMNAAIMNAKKAAVTERELNEFLAHEVRNPLSAAISACSFVNSAVVESVCITDAEFQKSLQDDVRIIGSSLHFINDFLRSMLDIHRAAENQLELKLNSTDLLKDILEPVSNMFYQRDTDVDIIVDCPENMIIATDCLRLKQIILNLGRNSAKFVESGFILFNAAVVDGKVELYVEDSGPGIPVEKRAGLFEKFQPSLDVLCQGTGIGLCLCKNLTLLLGGDIWLDESYDSGIEGSPGTRFVIQLNSALLPLSSSLEAEEIGETREADIFSSANELSENLLVLFVDDDLTLRKLFSRAIMKVAPTWKIQEAANGETALRLVDSETYDLIFMDQYMASTEKQLLGTETVRALRAKGVSSILCGLSANDIEQSFVSAGADCFIMKPIPCEQSALKRELFRITSGRRSRSATMNQQCAGVCRSLIEEGLKQA